MRTTIRDVAKAANVSPSTVSLILNNRSASFSPETRNRVLQAAERLRYRPNHMAVALTSRRTNTIGVIVPDISNLFHATYCEQIDYFAKRHSYSTIVRIAQGGVEETVRLLYDFEDRAVDGVIVTTTLFSDPRDTATCIQAIQELQIPVMLTDRVPRELSADAVLPNDYLGGCLATQHLIDLGHRRIGCVTGSAHYENCIHRLRGYRDTLEKAGIPYDETLVYVGDWQISSGLKALPYLLGKRVTGVFAFNDMMAYGLYKQAHSYSLKIPNDLSVIGFDDLTFSDLINPPLTTLEYPVTNMAEAVIECILAKIKGEEVTERPLIFDPVLKVRGSTRSILES